MSPKTTPSNLIGTPNAEINIDDSLVKKLIASQHPDFAHLPLQHLDSGWDNTLFRLGNHYLVRLPRRKIAAQLLQNEQKWLPVLARRLPIDAPVPIRIGKPAPYYPWNWSITPFFEGKTANEETLDDSQATVMMHFLKALHLPAPKEAPTSMVRGIPLSTRAEILQLRWSRLKSQTSLLSPKIGQIWQEALKVRPHSENCWIHGDLHPRNVIVQKGVIRAIIDWGDLTSGDVASDLACIWMLFEGASVRQKAIEVYCPSPALLARAKGWAVYFAVVLLDTGLVDNPVHAKIGRSILKNLNQSDAPLYKH